jgi:hypothetical protein
MKKLLLIFIFLVFSFSLAKEKQLKSNSSIDTFIISAPNFIIEDNKASFEFQAVDYSKKSKKLYFQIKLWPIDKEWQNIYVNKKTYNNLLKGNYLYIFQVRAINEKGEHDPSPAVFYFNTKISNLYKDISISPSLDGFKVTLRNTSKKEIQVSGWTFKSALMTFQIPKAVKDWNPNPSLRREEDIILKPNDKLVIEVAYENENSVPKDANIKKITISPLGVNFLGNQCFNYLNKNFKLNYPVIFCDKFNLKKQDLLNEVLIGKINSQCAVKLSSIGCGPLDNADYRKLSNDYQCLRIAENFFNYSSCYERNRNNLNFFAKEWRVYFDPRSISEKLAKKPLSPIFRTRFERIRLEDWNGNLVNEYKIF